MYFSKRLSLVKSCLSFLTLVLFISTTIEATTSSITTNFSSTSDPAGDYLYVNIAVKYTGSIPSGGLVLYFVQGSITAGGTTYTIPNATLTISPTGSNTLTYGTQWTSNVVATSSNNPFSSGEAFFTGVAIQIPNTIPGNLSNVTVSGNFLTNQTSGASLEWQWGAALYNSSMGTNYNSFGITLIGAGGGNPVNKESDFISGGGTGGSSYTGNLTSLKSLVASNIALGIPEPKTYLILGSSLLFVLFIKRKRDQKMKTKSIS